jgi:hypothetical protein
MKKIIMLIVLLGLLAACDSQTGQENGDEPPPAESITPDSESVVDVPADAAVVLRQEGGMEGLTQEWTIYQDGRVVDMAGNTQMISEQAVEGLVTTVESAGFFDLEADYMPADPCCDRFTYWLAVRQDDRVHVVQAMDGDDSAPPEFWTVVAAVNSTVEGAGGR